MKKLPTLIFRCKGLAEYGDELVGRSVMPHRCLKRALASGYCLQHERIAMRVGALSSLDLQRRIEKYLKELNRISADITELLAQLPTAPK